MQILRARGRRLANRNLVIGHTVFPFDSDGITTVVDQGRYVRQDYEVLLRQNGLEPLEGWAPAGFNTCNTCGNQVTTFVAEGMCGPCVVRTKTEQEPIEALSDEEVAATQAAVEKANILVTLSDEELKDVKSLSEAEIRAALEEGRREREAAERGLALVPKASLVPGTGSAAPPPIPKDALLLGGKADPLLLGAPGPQTYELVIQTIPEGAEIALYRVIRDQLGMDMKKIRDVLTSSPIILLSTTEKSEADQMRDALLEINVESLVIKGPPERLPGEC